MAINPKGNSPDEGTATDRLARIRDYELAMSKANAPNASKAKPKPSAAHVLEAQGITVDAPTLGQPELVQHPPPIAKYVRVRIVLTNSLQQTTTGEHLLKLVKQYANDAPDLSEILAVTAEYHDKVKALEAALRDKDELISSQSDALEEKERQITLLAQAAADNAEALKKAQLAMKVQFGVAFVSGLASGVAPYALTLLGDGLDLFLGTLGDFHITAPPEVPPSSKDDGGITI